MSFLMTSLVWPLKGFSIQWTEQAREDQPTTRTTPRGPWRPLPLLWKTPPSCTILTGQKGHGEPRRSWPQTSLSLRPHQATRPLPPAGVRPPFLTGSKWLPRHTPSHAEASHSIYVRTEARERRTQEPPQPPGRKGNTRGRGKHMRHSSPSDPSWSPGRTRSSYSDRNGCRHPWRPRGPGSPWQPSGSGRPEPSWSGQVGPGVGAAGPQRPLASSQLQPVCAVCWPHTRKQEEGDTCPFFKKKKYPNKIFKES